MMRPAVKLRVTRVGMEGDVIGLLSIVIFVCACFFFRWSQQI